MKYSWFTMLWCFIQQNDSIISVHTSTLFTQLFLNFPEERGIEASITLMWGDEKIQGAEEGSLPEGCNSEGRLLIRKRGLPEQCSSEDRFLNKETSACTAQFWGQAPENNRAHLLTLVGNWIFQETISILCYWVGIVPWMT